MKSIKFFYDGHIDVNKLIKENDVKVHLIHTSLDDIDDSEVYGCEECCEGCTEYEDDYEYEFVKNLVEKIKNEDFDTAIEILTDELNNACQDGYDNALDDIKDITDELRD